MSISCSTALEGGGADDDMVGNEIRSWVAGVKEMPSLTSALENTLHLALSYATERSHAHATIEHLVLALIDDEDAARVMEDNGVDVQQLGDKVTHYLDTDLNALKVDGDVYPQPDDAFQRVVQSAIINVVSTGDETVSGADVLAVLSTEFKTESPFGSQE